MEKGKSVIEENFKKSDENFRAEMTQTALRYFEIRKFGWTHIKLILDTNRETPKKTSKNGCAPELSS